MVRENAAAHASSWIRDEEAATVPLVCVTALCALRGGAGMRPGERVVALALSRRVPERLRQLVARSGAEALAMLTDLVESGSSPPMVDCHPLAKTADALEHYATRHAQGKVVIAD